MPISTKVTGTRTPWRPVCAGVAVAAWALAAEAQSNAVITRAADVNAVGRAWQLPAAAVVGGFALLAVIWIVLLRRRAARQQRETAAAREANAVLEQRVQERTKELEHAKEELHKALAAEREVGELRARFVSMVSHEFRTPLGIIMSAVELLRGYLDRLPAERRTELLEDIYSSTRRMSGLMEQVLLLGRVESGRAQFRPTALNLPELCQALIDETYSAVGRRCEIALDCGGDLDGAQGDQSLIRQSLNNLLSNAVKYSPAESTVHLRVHRNGSDVVFSVQDCGIGIPKSEKAQLFQAFQRCSNVGDAPGTGLGLLIVRRCVELHGGTIDLESEVGAGTCFRVTLPLFQPVAAAA